MAKMAQMKDLNSFPRNHPHHEAYEQDGVNPCSRWAININTFLKAGYQQQQV